MGHLINPIAFRLGFTKSWESLLYIRNIYYAEYFHHILHIRNFLYFYLTKDILIEEGILLSHIYLYKYQKVLNIRIFLYHMELEKKSYSLFNHFYEMYYKLLSSKAFKLPRNYFSIHNADLFVYVFLFYNLFFKRHIIKESVFFERNKKNLSSNLNLHAKTLILLYNQLLLTKLNSIGKKPIIDNLAYKAINKDTEQSLIFIKSQTKKLKVKIKRFYKKYFYPVRKLLNNYIESQSNGLLYIKNRKIWLEFDNLINIINNTLNISFILFFFYIAKKIGFPKFKIHKRFFVRWVYILEVLSFYKKISYNQKYAINYPSFYLFLSIIYFLSLKNYYIRMKFYIRNLLYDYTYMWLGTHYFFTFFKVLSHYFKSIFSIITPFFFFNLIYYIMSYRDVTAHFLSKYIGLKLQKGHYLFHIVNPLRKELSKLYRIKRSLSNKRRFRRSILKHKKSYKKFLARFYIIFLELNYLFYLNFKNFISFELLDCIFYIKSLLDRKKEILKKKYLYIFFLYFNWSIIFYKIFSFLNNNNLKNLIRNKLNQVRVSNSFYWLSFNTPIYNNIIYFKIISFRWLNFSINFSKFFFNYIYYNYLWLKIIGIQKRLLRHKIFTKDKFSLKGYKMVFKGRFSRKQKARYIWLSGGKIAINTLDSMIDYSFFTIPLRNSAVSIKIWLNRNVELESYKFLLKY